jgi:hypothetical protein
MGSEKFFAEEGDAWAPLNPLVVDELGLTACRSDA